jgi:glutathione synthase/RimK-type ligase-like ATP-grasp enzyme
MTQTLFVVDKKERWTIDIPEVDVIDARQYLTDPTYSALRNAKVFNLCKSYSYQSIGYYVSLLAEARGHRPKPNIVTIQDMKSLSILRTVSSDLDELIQKSLAHLQSDKFELSVYFSRNVARHYDRLSRHFFNLFQVPFFRVYFEREEGVWCVRNISPLALSEIPEAHFPTLVEFIKDYFTRKRATLRRKTHHRYSLAVLADKSDLTPPSNTKAMQRFLKAAESMSIEAEVIEKDDYDRISEFDALFIRTTTTVNNYTYRFARKAEAEGLVVIDDPQSIVKCANKVFLAELFDRHHIRTPHTVIVHKGNYKEAAATIGFPCVLKQPDSSFSLGVTKVSSQAEYELKAEQMLEKSDLVIVQSFLPTEFDWRIGIIDGKPFYACKYHMAPRHWQIYNHEQKGNDSCGRVDTLPVEVASRHIVQMALKAANLIGDGLYGVDMKEVDGKCYVIEVNDNPNLDAGIEDEILRERLYERVMEVFWKRLEQKRNGYEG